MILFNCSARLNTLTHNGTLGAGRLRLYVYIAIDDLINPITDNCNLLCLPVLVCEHGTLHPRGWHSIRASTSNSFMS